MIHGLHDLYKCIVAVMIIVNKSYDATILPIQGLVFFAFMQLVT